MAFKRVDVHHHFVPPFYAKVVAHVAKAIQDAGGDPSGWKTPEWTLDKDVEFNNEGNIAFTFLSITAPGPCILPVREQAAFCRQANEYAARICAEGGRDRYGFFATIPSPVDDAAAAQAEIAHALDELGADGVTLYTRYGAGNCYLGHPALGATWALLDARAAVVFVHPTHPADTALVSPSLPQPVIDYPHETTRAAVDLILSGTLRARPRVRVILPHAGGTLPFLALRPAAMAPYLPRPEPDRSPFHHPMDEESFLEDARRFYFDTALSAGAPTLDLLKAFARPGRVLYGSDYPYAPTPTIKRMDGLLDEYGTERDRDFARSVGVGAALELFPRLAGIVD